MTKILLLGLALQLSFVRSAFAGHDVGNGGGFALCSDGNYYTYDLLLSSDAPYGPLRTFANFPEYINSIYIDLKVLDSSMADSFKYFMTLLYTQKAGEKFQWFPQKNLPLMWNPEIESQLPNNCKRRFQAAYYFPKANPGDNVRYMFDKDLLEKVLTQPQGALQISFLWVHEFLWNYFNFENESSLRLFNRMLHSKRLSSLSKAEYFQIKSQLFVKAYESRRRTYCSDCKFLKFLPQ